MVYLQFLHLMPTQSGRPHTSHFFMFLIRTYLRNLYFCFFTFLLQINVLKSTIIFHFWSRFYVLAKLKENIQIKVLKIDRNL